MDNPTLIPDIQMVDLKAQLKALRAEIDHGIQEILDSGAFIKGPPVKAFQKDLSAFLNGAHVTPCANGTDALQIALMALDLKEGDEVITTPFTFVATAEVIELLKLKTVFIDIEPGTFNMDTKQLESLISPKTKVILPVHLFGQCSNMDQIMEVAEKHQLFVVEDNAQSIGSVYQFSDGRKVLSGTIGHIGCTSFYPSKNLGAFGDAGAVFTMNEEFATAIDSIANHGQSERYMYGKIGINSRMDSFQAVVLNAKLKELCRYNQSRQYAAGVYNKELAGIEAIELPVNHPSSSHVYHQYTLRVKDGKRDALKAHLQEKRVPSMIYYPYPLHLQEAYKHLGYQKGDFPVTEQSCHEVLSLPMHSELSDTQLNYICESIKSFFN